MSRDPRTVKIGSRLVGDDAPVFIVAEAGSNHNADLGLARELVKRAASVGADAVKFQLFRADALYPSNCGIVDTPMGPADLFDVFIENALPAEWLPELNALAQQEGILFLCTAFDEDSVDTLARLDPAALKIASPELNHLPLLRSAAQLGKPLICSTGLCTLADIEEALATIAAERAETEVVLLQCVSAYPLPPEESNLRAIDTLRRAFAVPVGLSDHTMDPERTPAIASSIGACLIEKHITLDRSMHGPDHPFSLEPREFERLVTTVRRLDGLAMAERLDWVRLEYGESALNEILGNGRKEIQPAERPLYPNDKRSIHALRDIPAGETLSPANVRVLRSERHLTPGLHPRHWETVCGSVTTAAISMGDGVSWDILLARPARE